MNDPSPPVFRLRMLWTLDHNSSIGGLEKKSVSLEDENGCVSNSSINGAILKDTISPNKPIISDVSVDSNGKSVISWSSSSTDVDVYAIYLLDEFGAWITLDSVYGFNNNTFTFSASNAVNTYETFDLYVESTDPEVTWSEEFNYTG